jgi:cellulose synthase operon protein YhjQ
MGGLEQGGGISTIATMHEPSLWDTVYASALGVDFVPYGNCGERQRIAFEEILGQEDDWLLRKLHEAKLPENTIVLLDTPPGPSVYLDQAFLAADFVCVVVMADAASFATLTEMEMLINSHSQRTNKSIETAYIVNHASKNQLAQDVLAFFLERLGSRVVPIVIPESEHIEEALAYELPVLQYKPEGLAASAIQRIVDWLLRRLEELQFSTDN